MKLYDTLSRKFVDLEKKPGEKIAGYVCGITPYDEPHLGHVRTALVFDLFHRYVKAQGYKPVFSYPFILLPWPRFMKGFITNSWISLT